MSDHRVEHPSGPKHQETKNKTGSCRKQYICMQCAEQDRRYNQGCGFSFRPSKVQAAEKVAPEKHLFYKRNKGDCSQDPSNDPKKGLDLSGRAENIGQGSRLMAVLRA
jgi:hypothetical protein